MSFSHPLVLLGLSVPVLLLVWVWKRQGWVSLPFDHGAPGRQRLLDWSLRAAESLPALLLGVVILLLAGPTRLGAPEARRKMTNIEFCVDISGSMMASFGSGTRYDGAMEAINKFLDCRQGDSFGLTFFGNNVLHWVPLTSDVSAIRCAPPFMRPENVPPWYMGTLIGKALLSCREVLASREEGDRMVILVSDGESADLGSGSEEEIGEKLRAEGISVFAIHISDSEVPAEIVTLTRMTGGEVFNPSDPEGLEEAFRRIDTMKRASIEKLVADTLDHFGPLAMAGLILLGLLQMTLMGLRSTPW